MRRGFLTPAPFSDNKESVIREGSANDTMRLRLETDYGIRCMLYLAQHTDYVQAAKIAAAMEVPENVVPRVLSRLKKAGLVQARSGVAGGHRLSRPASEITMLDIIACMEDHTELGRNLDFRVKSPEQSVALSGMQHYFQELQRVMEDTMRSITVEQMVDGTPA